MNNKPQLLSMLENTFTRWQALLAGLGEAEIAAPSLADGWSVKDVVAHLWAWQQVSLARLRAAQHGGEPALPAWLAGLDPESEEALEQFNARIYETYRREPWSRVRQGWQDNFESLLAAARAMPEQDLVEKGKYPWLKGYALAAVLEGTDEHHREHLESLPDHLAQRKQP